MDNAYICHELYLKDAMMKIVRFVKTVYSNRAENLHRYGELILHCTVNITHTIRECSNSLVLKYVCALLNSGGGILHMRNLDIQVHVIEIRVKMIKKSSILTPMQSVVTSNTHCWSKL